MAPFWTTTRLRKTGFKKAPGKDHVAQREKTQAYY
jgi:hypothetical protein